MTLKKYNIFAYFIILLNLVVNVIIAQKNTLVKSPTTTSISSRPSSTLIPPPLSDSAIDECLNNSSCIDASKTLTLCNGNLTTPDEYIEKGIRFGIYKPTDRSLASCMCNEPYYNTLSICLECFNNSTGTNFTVSPLEEYKSECDDVGTTFTQTMPMITSGLSPNIKKIIISVVVVVILASIGFAIFKFYKKKRAMDSHRIAAEGGGNIGTNSKYPPPPPPTAQFNLQYAPPTDTTYYPPPPGGQGEQQYPPPPSEQQYPPPPQQHEHQGGQADSYYDSF